MKRHTTSSTSGSPTGKHRITFPEINEWCLFMIPYHNWKWLKWMKSHPLTSCLKKLCWQFSPSGRGNWHPECPPGLPFPIATQPHCGAHWKPQHAAEYHDLSTSICRIHLSFPTKDSWTPSDRNPMHLPPHHWPAAAPLWSNGQPWQSNGEGFGLAPAGRKWESFSSGKGGGWSL